MKSLQIDLNDSERIVIRPNEEVDLALWQLVKNAFSIDAETYSSARFIEISVDQFIDKADWLRAVWAIKGHTYTISNQALELAKKARAGARNFNLLGTLAPDRYRGEIIEIPNLVKGRNLTVEQNENVLCLLDMENGANFSVPGAGKTLTALAVWQVLRSRGKLSKVLVVCPRSAFEAWKTELRDSFDLPDASHSYQNELVPQNALVCLVNYEQLENVHRRQYLESWVKRNDALLIVDEAHRIKGGRSSVRWAAVRSISEVAKRTDVLTGTPMPQGPKDLVSLYSAAWPRLSTKDLDEKVLVRLKRKTAFVRTTKDELRLPEATLRVISEEAGPIHSKIISALRDKYSGTFSLSIAEGKNLARKGKAVMTMLAAATNPGLLVRREFEEIEMGFSWPPKSIQDDLNLTSLIENYLHHELPWKFRYLALRVEELTRANQKVLIWTSFVGNIAAIKTVLSKFNPAVVFGATSLDLRESEIARFRNDPNCSVLISNPQTLGEGISLHQVCHNEIFVDRTYNAGLYLQAVDRIHRLGLPADQVTNIEILQTQESIDESVGNRLEQKISSLATFLQDKGLTATSLPQDDAFAPIDLLGLTDEDFEDIAKFWTK